MGDLYVEGGWGGGGEEYFKLAPEEEIWVIYRTWNCILSGVFISSQNGKVKKLRTGPLYLCLKAPPALPLPGSTVYVRAFQLSLEPIYNLFLELLIAYFWWHVSWETEIISQTVFVLYLFFRVPLWI